MPSEQEAQDPVRARKSGLVRGALRGVQVAALAAVLVPLGSVPVTSTDEVIGSPRAALAQGGGGCTSPPCSFITPIPSDVTCDGGEGGGEGSLTGALAVV